MLISYKKKIIVPYVI